MKTEASAPQCAYEHCKTPPLILVVDDDARTRRFVRAVVAYAMTSVGTVADVIEAENFSGAHSSASGAARPIDLLITDIRLGMGKSGVELARDLSSTNLRMRILLMSGTDVLENDLPKEWHFLAKPFRMSDMVELVKALT